MNTLYTVTGILKLILKVTLPVEQTDFTVGTSCIDNIFVLQHTVENYRRFGRETHILFIHYIKAFCMINRHDIWKIMAGDL